MDIQDESPAVEQLPPTVRIPRRALVVFAGLPGAGKSTVLGKLRHLGVVSSLDSEQVRAALRAVLPERLPYRWYRFVVHMVHRARIGWECATKSNPVVAHEPSTRASTRAMLVLFGRLTGRKRILLWLHADPAEALAGQYERGRLIRERSFHRHVRRAERVHRALRAGTVPHGWDAAHVFTRRDLESGLRLEMRE